MALCVSVALRHTLVYESLVIMMFCGEEHEVRLMFYGEEYGVIMMFCGKEHDVLW